MYVIKYKFPSLPQMCLVKNPSSQNPEFCIFGTKDLSREKCTTLGLECRSAEVELQVGSFMGLLCHPTLVAGTLCCRGWL